MTKDSIGWISATLFGTFTLLVWFTDLYFSHNGVMQGIAAAALITMFWRISKN